MSGNPSFDSAGAPASPEGVIDRFTGRGSEASLGSRHVGNIAHRELRDRDSWNPWRRYSLTTKQAQYRPSARYQANLPAYNAGIHSPGRLFVFGCGQREGRTCTKHHSIAIYVDDLITVGSRSYTAALKQALSDRFHMTNLGPCFHHLGMVISWDRVNRKLSLSQKTYIEKIF